MASPGACQQGVGDGNDRRSTDGLFEASASGFAPCGYESAVPEFGHRVGRQEDLVPGHCVDRCLEPGATAPAQRSAEDAGVNKDSDSHEWRASANASSSASESSSIGRDLVDARGQLSRLGTVGRVTRTQGQFGIEFAMT